MDKRDLAKARDNLVVKDNELIRHAKYFSLTAHQQKLVAYIISMIKPDDTELTRYEIETAKFCEICGLNKSKMYSEIKDIIDNLDNKSFWVENDEKIYKFRWFSEFEIIKGGGKVRIKLNSNLQKYLINLREDFTAYRLYNILALSRKYSIRLYEWFKSYEFMSEKQISLKELKYILDADGYSEYKNFRRRVIEPAIDEINKYTDLEVSFDTVKSGKTITDLIFYIRFKDTLERYDSYLNTKGILNKKANLPEGQISLFDLRKEDFD